MNLLDTRLRAAAVAALSFTLCASVWMASGPAAAQGVTVSESGQALYAMPIAVPPGVAGMEPKLSLVYNSSGINGPVGVGWAVQGVSQITRCNQVSRGADGKPAVKSVNLDANDALCLDGQRLIRVTASAGAWEGTASTDQNNVAQGNVPDQFRTEVDSFSRIRAKDAVLASNPALGPATFVVESKAGLISEYGRSGGSEEGLVQTVGGSKPGTVSAWLLRRVTDTVGNTMVFHYEQAQPTWGTGPNGVATSGREWNLVGVSYGCKTSGACSSVHVVKLIYGDRADKAESYHLGSKVLSTKLLGRIEVRVGAAPNGTNVPTGGTLVRAYKLTHKASPATSRSLLAAIAECASEAHAADNCLPANAFRYSESTRNDESSAFNLGSETLSSRDGSHGVITGDFNGDGKTDLLRWGKHTNSALALGVVRFTNTLWLADAKQSGKFNQAAAFNQAMAETSAPSDATNSASVAKLGGAPDGGREKDGYVETFAVDINGDGRADLVSACKQSLYCGDQPLRMWLSLSSSNDPTAADYGAFREIDVPTTGPREFNASGADLGRSISGPLYTRVFPGRAATSINGSSGSSTRAPTSSGTCPQIGSGGQYSDALPIVVTEAVWQDFDGDGRVDLVNFERSMALPTTGCQALPADPATVRRTMRYYTGRGDGTFVLRQTVDMPFVNRDSEERSKSGLSYMEVMDINSDGRPDIVFRKVRWVQNSEGLFVRSVAHIDPSPQHIDYRMLAVDVNGDGKTDIITLDPDATVADPDDPNKQVSANPYSARLFVNRGDGSLFRDDRPIAVINSLGQRSIKQLPGSGRVQSNIGAFAGNMSYGSGLNGSMPMDFNGDGQTDFLSWVGSTLIEDSDPDAGGMRLFVAKGGTDGGKSDGTIPGVSSAEISHGLPGDLSTSGNSFSGGDFLGLGSASFIKMGNNGGNSLHGRFGVPPDMLEHVVTPTGLRTTTLYSSTAVATNGIPAVGTEIIPAVYQNVRPPLNVPAGNAALTPADFTNVGTYPIYYAHPAQWVVGRTIQSGASASVTTAFLYRGMATDLSGGSNLGFEAVSKYFPYANGGMLVTTSEYLQDPDQRQYQGMPRCTYTLYNSAWKPNEVKEPVDEEINRDRRRGVPNRKSTRDTVVGSKPLAASSFSECSDSDSDTGPGPFAGNARAIAMTTYVYGDVRAQTAPATLQLPTEVASLVKRPYQRQSIERKWDLNKWDLNNPSQLVSKVVTTNSEMSAYGDVVRSMAATTQYDRRLGEQTWTKETTNEYNLAAISDTQWHLGRLSRSTVRSTTPTTAPPTPNSALLTAQQRATQDPALTATPPKPLTPEQLSAILQLLLLDD